MPAPVQLAHEVREGPGPTVVLVHSLGTDLRSWDAVLPHLPAKWRVIRVDLLGHGASPPGNSAKYGLLDYVHALETLLRARRAVAPVVCGVSIGGHVAVHLASLDRHPDPPRPSAIVASSCGLRMGESQDWDARIATVLSSGLEPVLDQSLQRWVTREFAAREPGKVKDLAATFLATSPAGYADACAALRDSDLAKRVAMVDVPVLCVTGDRDEVAPPAASAALAAALPQATHQVLPGLAHLPHVEDPAGFAAMLTACVDGVTT